jgi:hypothetical protein
MPQPFTFRKRLTLKRVFDIDISVCPLGAVKGLGHGRKTISLPLSDG